MRRIVGVLVRPRTTMAALVAAPTFVLTWTAVLLTWLACASWLLTTDVGRQATVDERVRVVEAFGGQVDDEQYAALQASPPIVTYFTSGGRLLLSPPVTLLAALGLMWLARMDGRALGAVQSVAISVHATVVLALQQLVATPLHYVRESITSPTNLAAFLPMIEEGTWPARLFGAVDVFGLWWLWLMAVGVAAATGRPARRYLVKLLAVYLGVAAVMAAVLAVAGGS